MTPIIKRSTGFVFHLFHLVLTFFPLTFQIFTHELSLLLSVGRWSPQPDDSVQCVPVGEKGFDWASL